MYFTGSDFSASKPIYEEANAFVEKWSNLIYFAFVKVTFPGILVPYLIRALYVSYFTTDLIEDAFQLPFIIW